MTEVQKSMALFSGSVNPELAEEIAKDLNVSLGNVKLEKFANGEIYARYMPQVGMTFSLRTVDVSSRRAASARRPRATSTWASSPAKRAKRAAAAFVSSRLIVLPNADIAAAGCASRAALVHKAGWALRKRAASKASTAGWVSAVVMAAMSRKVLPSFFACHATITNHLY